MNHLDKLENKSIHILREAYAKLQKPVHALVHRQGQHGSAVACAQGIFRSCTFSACSYRYPLQKYLR